MNGSLKVARVGGIDIFVNWTWLIIFFLLTWSLGDYFHHQFPSWGTRIPYIVSAIAAVLLFVTVLLHELAHSFTAKANGLPVHTIILYLFGGVSNLQQEPPTPKIELLVAAAGPLTSLVLGAIFWTLAFALRSAPSELVAIFGYLGIINVVLAVFNLIPGFPLDGGRVLRAILWMATGSFRRATHIASIVGQVIGYLFIAAGVIDAFTVGDLVGGIWLAFIGWFLQNAASQSYQQAVMTTMLRNVDVKDVMDPAPVSVSPDTPIASLVYRHLLDENQRAVPVVENGQFVGLVTLSDVRHVARSDWDIVPVSRIMQPLDKLCTVTPNQHLADAMQILAENSYHQLPVMQDGRLVGMLNRAHVIRYLHTRQALGQLGAKPPVETPPEEQRRAG